MIATIKKIPIMLLLICFYFAVSTLADGPGYGHDTEGKPHLVLCATKSDCAFIKFHIMSWNPKTQTVLARRANRIFTLRFVGASTCHRRDGSPICEDRPSNAANLVGTDLLSLEDLSAYKRCTRKEFRGYYTSAGSGLWLVIGEFGKYMTQESWLIESVEEIQ